MGKKHKKKSTKKIPPQVIGQAQSNIASANLAKARNYASSGYLQQAIIAYETLLAEHTTNADIYLELGTLYFQLSRLSDAESSWRKSLELRPRHTDTQCNLAIVIWQQYGIDAAMPYFEETLRNHPKHTGTMYNYAGILLQEGKCEQAIFWFDKVLKSQPGNADAWMYKGNAHYERADFKFAMECYRKVVKFNPCGGARIRLAAAIPMIPESNAHIQQIRAGFMKQLQALIDANISVSDPMKENGYTNFFLAYHGLDDLPLQKKYAELYEKACPSLLYESANCINRRNQPQTGKIRVAFISKYFKGHSIGKTSSGIIEKLDRSAFEVIVIFLGRPVDEVARKIQAAADEVLVLPNDLPSARHIIEQKNLDILFYQDIGMDPFTFFLSFSRLAPVQCASFGHPVTTGISNVDYYISTELWEPVNADAHYSEKLVCLNDVASVAYYYKPKEPEELKPRNYFNLPDEAHIYICPQTLFKFHPDFDSIMAEILRRDSEGIIVLIEGKHKPWADILRQRFKRTISDVENRILFVARQYGDDYFSLLAAADVMLDTIHFCGFNTTLEGFSVGLPVVTIPGAYMRSRHTAAFYKKICYTECIATNVEHYIEIAVRLGTDKEYRNEVISQIQNKLDIVWQEEQVVREFERFFKEAIDTL